MLETSNHELRVNHQQVVAELVRLHRTVQGHDRIMADLMKYLTSMDVQQRRNSKVLFPNATENTSNNLTPTSQNINAADDDLPASPLQHAQQLLQEFNADNTLNFATFDPTFAPNNGARGSGSAHSSGSLGYSKLSDGQLENIVYPIGAATANGIDPMYSEHLPNIPYPLPAKGADVKEIRANYAAERKKTNLNDPGWIRNPKVLLVEDDPTCRQIGAKFLYSFACTIETALDGLEAVSKIQDGGKYDLILMDIIMPNLDGVSACHIIRQFDRTPIVAMTSNIRSDDIQMYFQHGMDDVLPKPFTRKSLLDMLEKHLVHMKKIPAGMEPPPQTGINPTITQSSGAVSAQDSLSAAASPAGSTGTWNSPNQYAGVSPIVSGGMTMPYTSYMDTNSAAYTGQPTTPIANRQGVTGLGPQHRRGPSDAAPDAMSNKRQRISGNYTGQTMTARQP